LIPPIEFTYGVMRRAVPPGLSVRLMMTEADPNFAMLIAPTPRGALC
jgi:hypothetical protein